ncbi:MAG: HAD family hydrolase [Planctomycetota bacterium]
MTRPAVFLDRDGTLNRERGYVVDPEQLEVLPNAPIAVRRLHRAGWPVVVVTNQSGIAKGLYSEADLARVHAKLHAALDGIPRAYFHCPHHPDAPAASGLAHACACRKPGDGLLRQAARTLDLALDGSILVGDSARDLLPARTFAMRTALVRSGKPWQHELARLAELGTTPTLVADDLLAVVDQLELAAPR